ncbi:MAG: MFS transporter [Verrucomicrobiota bacterium JB024]|nr:MFS transporter [Verrucomicrobiota bacterium JB024]
MSQEKHKPVVAPEDRVPVGQKVAYGAGCMTGQFVTGVTLQMFNPVFNIMMGISPAVIGGVLMFYRLWDSVTDVVMGNISDNARTRWGRRRPFIIIGSVLAGFILPWVWQASRDWSDTTIIAYMIVTGVLLYTASTIWGMPYYSLGMELTPDYNERTRVTAVRAVFEKLAGLFAGWMLALTSMQIFADPVTGEPDVARGMSYISIFIGVCAILFGILPGLFVKERYYQKDAAKQKKIGLVHSMKVTLTCKPFMVLMSVYLLQVIGSSMVGALGMYLNIYYVNSGDIQTAGIIQGWKSTATLIPGILSVPFWAWVSEKLGKRHALALTILLGFIANILIYFCYTPEHPYLQIVPHVFLSAFGSAIWMLIPSMQADIADYDELNTGERREGSFSSISSWFFKLAMTLTTGVSGVIITLTGFDVVKYGKAQPPEVLQRMLEWYVFMPMVLWVIALFMLSRYKLTHGKVMEIRTQLEARRGVV